MFRLPFPFINFFLAAYTTILVQLSRIRQAPPAKVCLPATKLVSPHFLPIFTVFLCLFAIFCASPPKPAICASTPQFRPHFASQRLESMILCHTISQKYLQHTHSTKFGPLPVFMLMMDKRFQVEPFL